MKAEERDTTMRAFRDGKIHVLVATTVIEVGIDVANATVMLIEHPERFGLAQLHQLRGRIGRGGEESYCILVADAGARERLRQFAQSSDGFRIAEMDLQERGMGQLAGSRQSGGMVVRFTDFSKDDDLIVASRKSALRLIEEDPVLSQKRHVELRKRLEQRYERGMELFRVG
jgi:ATP-dependent DNA helicase RecG